MFTAAFFGSAGSTGKYQGHFDGVASLSGCQGVRYRVHDPVQGRQSSSISLRTPHTLPDVTLSTSPCEGTDPYLGRVHPDDLESLLALVELVLPDAHAIVRVRDERGAWILVEHRVRVENDLVVLERLDVTMLEQERARQGRTDAYWRTILRNGHEPIAVLDPVTRRIRHATDHLAELLDTDPAWLEGRALSALVHRDDHDVIEAQLDQLDPNQGRLVTELRLLTPGADVRWMEAVLSDARHDPDVAAIVVNLRDIGDRKRAEEQLQSSEQLFRVLLNHLADGALVVDRGGEVRFASERVAEALGMAVDDVVGKTAPLRTRLDGNVALSMDASLPVAALDELPREVAGNGDRWFELSSHDLGDDPVVDGLVLVVRDITQQRRAVEQLRHELELDVLTGLVNRRGFEQRVSARLEAGERLHLAFLDLNGFKAINDTHGHAVGDELLRGVAERLRRATRPADIVARLGGDEFVVAAAVADYEMRELLIERLEEALSGAYQLESQRVHVSVSSGWSEVGGDIGLAEALHTADERMYADKRWQADQRRVAG